MVTISESDKKWFEMNNPAALAFLEQMVRQENLGKISVILTDRNTSFLTFHPNTNKMKICFTRYQVARTRLMAHEYPHIAKALDKKGVRFRAYSEWQWVILHEVCHAKNFWCYIRNTKKALKGSGSAPTQPNHDAKFVTTLTRMAAKYAPLPY